MQVTKLENIKKGSSYKNTVTFFEEDGSRKDVTGATLWWVLKDNIDDLDAAAIHKDSYSPYGDPTLGEFQVNLTPAQTAAFVPGKKFTGFVLLEASGEEWDFLDGDIILVEERVLISAS